MPNFILSTNLPKSKFPLEFLQKTTKILSKTLQKDESVISVTVKSDLNMIFGGTNEPCCTSILQSIGRLTPEDNKRHTKVLTEHLTSTLGIAINRMNIIYQDLEPCNVGYLGDTLEGKM